MTKKKKAFTLAEILITLSILGIVAAVTVPSIIQHYKKAITVTKLKIAYSTLQSAISMSEAINGNAEKWDYNRNGTTDVDKYILPYLAHYNSRDLPAYTIKDLAGNTKSNMNFGCRTSIDARIVTLKNGMDLCVRHNIHGLASTNYLFFVDIDGFNKGKNTVGKDIFVFTLQLPPLNLDSYIVDRTKRAFFEPGIPFSDATGPNGYTERQALGLEKNNGKWVYGNCDKNYGTSVGIPAGAACSYAIYQNGWKIPSNYPVGF